MTHWTSFKAGWTYFWDVRQHGGFVFVVGFIVAMTVFTGLSQAIARLVLDPLGHFMWARLGVVPLMFWLVIGFSLAALGIFALGWYAGRQLRHAELPERAR